MRRERAESKHAVVEALTNLRAAIDIGVQDIGYTDLDGDSRMLFVRGPSRAGDMRLLNTHEPAYQMTVSSAKMALAARAAGRPLPLRPVPPKGKSERAPAVGRSWLTWP